MDKDKLNSIKSEAKDGDIEFMFILANIYRTGKNFTTFYVPQNLQKSIKRLTTKLKYHSMIYSHVVLTKIGGG